MSIKEQSTDPADVRRIVTILHAFSQGQYRTDDVHEGSNVLRKGLHRPESVRIG